MTTVTVGSAHKDCTAGATAQWPLRMTQPERRKRKNARHSVVCLAGHQAQTPGAKISDSGLNLSLVWPLPMVSGGVPPGDTPLTLFLADGRELRWDEQDDLNTPTRLRGPLIRLGIKPRPLSPHSVGLLAWAITRYAVLRADATAKDEAIGWGESYMSERPVKKVSKSKTALWRAALQTWQKMDDYDPKGPRLATEHRPFVLIDTDTDERYIRRGDYAGHVRARRRGGIGWRKLASRMAEVRWETE